MRSHKSRYATTQRNVEIIIIIIIIIIITLSTMAHGQ